MVKRVPKTRNNKKKDHKTSLRKRKNLSKNQKRKTSRKMNKLTKKYHGGAKGTKKGTGTAGKEKLVTKVAQEALPSRTPHRHRHRHRHRRQPAQISLADVGHQPTQMTRALSTPGTNTDRRRSLTEFETRGLHLAVSPAECGMANARVEASRGRLQQLFNETYHSISDTIVRTAESQHMIATFEPTDIPSFFQRVLTIGQITQIPVLQEEYGEGQYVVINIKDNMLDFTINIIKQIAERKGVDINNAMTRLNTLKKKVEDAKTLTSAHFGELHSIIEELEVVLKDVKFTDEELKIVMGEFLNNAIINSKIPKEFQERVYAFIKAKITTILMARDVRRTVESARTAVTTFGQKVAEGAEERAVPLQQTMRLALHNPIAIGYDITARIPSLVVNVLGMGVQTIQLATDTAMSHAAEHDPTHDINNTTNVEELYALLHRDLLTLHQCYLAGITQEHVDVLTAENAADKEEHHSQQW